MDAFTDATRAELEAPTTGSALQRFRAQVQRVAHLMNQPEARRPFIALIAASQHDEHLKTALLERFIADRRKSARRLLEQISKERTNQSPFEPDIAIDLVYGALYYRLLITGQPLDTIYVDRILDATVGRE